MFDLLTKDQYTHEGDGEHFIRGVLTKQPKHMEYWQSGAIVLYVDGVNNTLDFVEKHMPDARRDKSSIAKGASRHSDFNYFDNWEECLDTYKNRPDSIRTFSEKETNVKVPESSGNDIYHDVVGDYIDVGRFLEGVPEVMGVASMGNPNNTFVSILVNLSATCYFDEKLLQLRSEYLLRIIDWLEAQRVRTSVRAFDSNQCLHMEIQAKRFEDHLNMNDLAILGNPDFLRRILFRVTEHSATFQSGYGTACQYSAKRLKLPELVNENGLVLFTENQDNAETIKKNFERVERELEEALLNDERNKTFIA